MVAGDDVVDLEGNFGGELRQSAIFASSLCSLPHQSL
jgi:hypothetical protein